MAPASPGAPRRHAGAVDRPRREPARSPSRTRPLLALLAGHLGQGLHRVHQIDQQRETALALQRAILGPAQLPDGFAVRYEPATRPLEVGGDWYDTVTLPDGRIGIVVGDCVGHGLQAATVMGQLRSACRALLLQDTEPGPDADRAGPVRRAAARAPCAPPSSAACSTRRPASWPTPAPGIRPAIVAHPDGTTRPARPGPVAAARRPPRPATGPRRECTVPARATLLLYTDGLVERRRQPLTAGIDQAGAGRPGRPRDRRSRTWPPTSWTSLAPAGGYDDDVALLLYRHPGPLEMDFPAESTQLAPVRTALRGWLDPLRHRHHHRAERPGRRRRGVRQRDRARPPRRPRRPDPAARRGAPPTTCT